MSTWIKRSEREPTKADYPIAAGAYLSNQTGGYWDEGHYRIPEALTNWQTHWRSIKADPPPRELTQREKDEAMAKAVTREWYKVDGGSEELALLAIYAERRQICNLLEGWFYNPKWGKGDEAPAELQAIRARLDEQGGGK